MLKQPTNHSRFSLLYRKTLSILIFLYALSADYADMNRGQLLAKIRELEEVSNTLKI